MRRHRGRSSRRKSPKGTGRGKEEVKAQAVRHNGSGVKGTVGDRRREAQWLGAQRQGMRG